MARILLLNARMGGEPKWNEVEVRRGRRGWSVTIPINGGGVLEYVYATKRKATFFASVFRLAPTWYPAPQRVCVARRKSPAMSSKAA